VRFRVLAQTDDTASMGLAWEESMAFPVSTKACPILSDETSPFHFFYERVQQAQERQNIKLNENVEFYVVNLLADYCKPMAVASDECLALLLKKALESDREQQAFLFKQMGDTALYYSGFFQEFFNRKSFDLKYYVSMGKTAYGHLSHLMKKSPAKETSLGAMFRDMSHHFSQAVDIVLDVAEHTSQGQETHRDTLSIYEAWLNTASLQLEKKLYERGLTPVPMSKKIMQ